MKNIKKFGSKDRQPLVQQEQLPSPHALRPIPAEEAQTKAVKTGLDFAHDYTISVPGGWR